MKYLNFFLLKRFFLVLFCFIVCLNNLSAQVISVTTKVDTNKIKVGEQTKIHFNININKAKDVIFPSFNDTLTNHIEIISKSKVDTIKNIKNEITAINQSLIITCFDSGFFVIPPFQFLIVDKKSKDTLITNSEAQLLSVLSIPVDTTKAIKDIKAPFKAPLTFKEILPYLLGGIGVIGLIFLIIWYIRKRKRNESIIPKIRKPSKPAHLIALEEIEKLKLEKLWQNNKTKEYYIKLTEILRSYLINRYGIDALEMTTEEIIHALNSQEIENIIIAELKPVLILADLVKFAKEQPLPNDNENSLLKSIDFINKTAEIVDISASKSELYLTDSNINNLE